MYGLTIHFKSIQLDNSLTQKNDKIRVTVSSFPNTNSESFVCESRKLNNCDDSYTLNITDQTKGILFLFEKKCLFHTDDLLASTIVNVNELPKTPNDANNSDIKSINIYEPLHDSRDEVANQNRQIFGKLIVQFSVTEPDSSKTKNNNKFSIGKIHRGKSYSKVNTHSYNNENVDQNQNALIE